MLSQRIFLASLLCLSACVNVTENVQPKLTLNVTAPTYPSKKFSAYFFLAGALQGVARSNTVTDASGKLTVTLNAVDAANCATTATMRPTAAAYTMHYRLDNLSNAELANPTGCATDAGFLASAGLGYTGSTTLTALDTTLQISQDYFSSTDKVQINLGSTGLNAVTRQTSCGVYDAQTTSPSTTSGAPLGFYTGSLAYSNGFAYPPSNFTLPGTKTGTTYKYACWIDANNSGAYNSGDLIASGSVALATTVSSWQTVP